MRQLRSGLISTAIISWHLFAALAFAQPAPDEVDPVPEASAAITLERIEQFQKTVAAATDLSDADKTQLAELIQQSLDDLHAAEAAEPLAKDYEERTSKIEPTRADLEKTLAKPSEPVQIAPGRSITDLESERVEIQTKITDLEQKLKLPNVDPAARTARRNAARTMITDLPAVQSELEVKLATPPPEGESALVAEARKMATLAQLRSVKSRLIQHQKELTLYDAGDAKNLPQLRREDLTRQLSTARKRLEAFNTEINRLKQAEAQRRAREAELAAINAQPQLKSILEENLEIARSEQELRSQHEADKAFLQTVENRYKEIEEDKKDAELKDAEIGLEKMGIWLRKQRDGLKDLDQLYEGLSERTSKETEALFEFYEREDQLDNLVDLDAEADKVIALSIAEGNAELDREDVIQVLRNQSVNLQKLVDEYGAYTETLYALKKEEERLKELAGEYANFLDERILWVRSHLPLSLQTLRNEGDTVRQLFSLTSWVSAVKSIAWDGADHLMLYGSVGLLLASLLVRRNRHGQQLQEVAKRASGRVTTSIAPTVHCVFLTSWLAVAWPGLLLFFAWRLHESSISTPELQTAAVNLARLASVFFLLEFIRQSLRSYGLAEAHFGWNGKTVRRVRRLLWSMVLVGLPIAAAVACLHQQDPGSRRDGIERLLFMGAMLVLTVFAHGLLHPTHGAVRQMKSTQESEWFSRLDYLWYVLGIGVPVVLAVFAAIGYYDTAVRLAIKVQRTAWLIVAALYLHALLVRWLMLRHRRLRIDSARERLAAAQDAAKSSVEGGAPLPDAETKGADLDSISQQSQRLLNTVMFVTCAVGLWFVWADVMPAIRFLDRWELWTTTVETVKFEEDLITHEVTPRPDIEVQAITIISLFQMMMIIFLTSTAARNIPGLLEISILPRLPIDRSTAYAITSLTRYGLVLIGLILASKTMGIGWAKVQWLAAALTFGLGFGLQEIFANFVSGLIILFEQPVRVGDVVTIDGVSGVVNRIRIRATTIVDWDRKEYIVPNREFITGRLLNWTLSDKTNRIVINVGVAYGSNPSQVRSIIMQLLEDYPNVLDDPPPLVTFEEFGDSSLNFVVRGYLPSLDNRLQTIHDLHTAIHDSLAVNGIEIPFPQRDLHLRTTVTLDEASRNGVHTSSNSSNGHAAPAAVEQESKV